MLVDEQLLSFSFFPPRKEEWRARCWGICRRNIPNLFLRFTYKLLRTLLSIYVATLIPELNEREGSTLAQTCNAIKKIETLRSKSNLKFGVRKSCT